MSSRNSKLLPVLRAMDAITAPTQPTQHGAYVSDYCEPQTARHDLCTDGGCECACHAEPQPEPRCEIAGCDETAVYTCVCCNRQVCIRDYDMSGAYLDEPGVCADCLFECVGGIACQVVAHGNR